MDQPRTRVDVRIPVALEEQGHESFSSALNLSPDGAFVARENPPEVGSVVSLVLSLPPDGVFERVRGRVVRHATSGEPEGFAVRFENVDPGTSARLRRFVLSAARA